MRQFQQVLLEGIRQAARPWLALPLYLTGLALGLAQAWPVTGAVGLGPLLEPLALGQDEAIAALLLGAGQDLAPGVATWLLVAALASLAYASAYNFFSGGLLVALTGRAGFWAGCRRYFWSFTGLGGLLVFLALLAVAAAAFVGSFGGLTAGALLALALLQLIGLLGEYARAVAVSRDRRNPLLALGGAGRFIARRLPGVLALAGLGLLLHWAVAAAYGALGGRAGYLAPLAQQLAALAWVWVKQLRLGWAIQYVNAAAPAAPPLIWPSGEHVGGPGPVSTH